MFEVTIGQYHSLVGHVVQLNVLTQRSLVLRKIRVVFLAGGGVRVMPIVTLPSPMLRSTRRGIS